MVSINNLCELKTEDANAIINSLGAKEAKKLLLIAVSMIKKSKKSMQYKNRLVKEKFDSTSERVMPPKSKTALDYEGNDSKDYKKRGRKKGDKNTYTALCERILKGEGKDGFIDGVPYEEIELETDSKCPICNGDLVEIGEDAMVKVVYVPGSYKLVVYRKKKKVCKKHCDEIFVPFIYDPISKSYISVSLLSKLIRDKFQYGLPPYRQIDDLRNNGINIGYNQIIHHMMRVGKMLKPLAEKIKMCAFKDNPVISIDETLYKLLIPDLKDDDTIRKKNYIYGIITDKIVSYTFTGSREIDWLVELFEKTKYKGCVTTDDYGGYNFLNKKEDIKHQLCLCHARRRMFYAYIATPEEIRDTEECMARKGLLLFREIFNEERKIKDKTIEEKTAYRQSKDYSSKIEALKKFCDETVPVQGSYLEDAINYTKSNWNHLWTYVTDGKIPVTNMTAELGMKKIALLRKNSLFFKNSTTAQINCDLMTIVQSAVKNGLDVYRYLNYVIHHINTAKIESLLPWSENLYELGENYLI